MTATGIDLMGCPLRGEFVSYDSEARCGFPLAGRFPR
jgi:hypothetical protein